GMDGLRRQVFGYGVGLGAYLTRSVVVRPRRLLEIGPRVGRGLSYYLSRRSERDKACDTSFPVTLKRLERLGLLYGPAAYLRSRPPSSKSCPRPSTAIWSATDGGSSLESRWRGSGQKVSPPAPGDPC